MPTVYFGPRHVLRQEAIPVEWGREGDSLSMRFESKCPKAQRKSSRYLSTVGYS